MRFTIFGSKGFVGSNLTEYLSQAGIDFYAPERDDSTIFQKNLGHVVYCIGLTADFRERPFDTVKAHVSYLAYVLEHAKFDSFLYLSSTRVYKKADKTNENVSIKVNSLEEEDLYNISKIMGESLCFSSKIPNVRVARISNIFGKDFSSNNFLISILRDAIIDGKIIFKTSLSSEKDYINIDDVVKMLFLIAQKGRHKIYNVASGVNISNRTLAKKIKNILKCKIEVIKNAETVIFPKISINRISSEFNFQPIPMLDTIDFFVTAYKKELKNEC